MVRETPEATEGATRAAEAPVVVPITERITSEPVIRVGVELGASAAVVMSTGGLRVRDAASGAELAAGEEILRFERAPGGASLVDPAGRIEGSRSHLIIEPLDPSAGVVLAGTKYRGAAEVLGDAERGLTVINRLDLEAYLLGVVPAEIGQRPPEEFAAVRAQAVAARTYTIASLGSRDSLGFDVFATVEDQAYGGVEVERAEIDRAIRETRGEILTFEGQAVLALYHSTCGGRTATRYEVWGEPDLPYLRSVRDRGEGRDDFCAISPRHRWQESWTAESINGLVRAELAGRLGVTASSVGLIQGIRVLSRTEHDRVDQLEVEADGGRYVVRKNDIRWVLRPSEGRILRSTDFVVRQGRVVDGPVVVEGRGFGHGIGMCQWGAIGRAREGQSYRQILAAYYQGAEITKLY
jgi:stage II sporulation protein D